jgi:hypothetical protein
MIKFKDINYPRRKEKEIITNLPNEIWKDIDDGYGKSKTCGEYEWIKR